MKIRMIAITGIAMMSLAACGSAISTSAPAATSTSRPAAVASHPATTTPAAQVTTPAVSATTAPATPTSAANTPPATTTVWCGTGNVNIYPTLSAWETSGGAYNMIYAFMQTTSYIEMPQQVVESPWGSYAVQLCGEVLDAYEYPPPVDKSTFAAAMSDFLQASQILHATPDASAVSAARPYLNSGTTELNAFRSATGINE
jgi:hypothetical protein